MKNRFFSFLAPLVFLGAGCTSYPAKTNPADDASVQKRAQTEAFSRCMKNANDTYIRELSGLNNDPSASSFEVQAVKDRLRTDRDFCLKAYPPGDSANVETDIPIVENRLDSRRVFYIKEIQTALELYFADNNSYPTSFQAVTLGTDSQRALCTGGWKARCAGRDTTYMGEIPASPIPAEAPECAGLNPFLYQSLDGSAYTLSFCLGGPTDDLSAGVHKASQEGIE